jgi:peptide/nickel transport system ATP-binding protein
VIAHRSAVPLSSARAEFIQALGRLDGAPPLAAFERPAGPAGSALVAWGLLTAAFAQTPELLLIDHLCEGLSPTDARQLEHAVLAAKAHLNCTVICATMSAETVIGLGGRLIVLRQGQIVEEGPVLRLTTPQAHSYTQTLFRDKHARDRSAARSEPIVRATAIRPASGPPQRDELSFELRRGASLALVGEEGSGRRSIARMILGMERIERGQVMFNGVHLGVLSPAMVSRLRRQVTMISGTDDVLDPRMALWDTITEPLRVHLHLSRSLVEEYGETALRRVGLASLARTRKVSEMSTFDRRRLQVARAIVAAPALTIADEPFRGLDAFARSVIRDLLQTFRTEEGPAFLVITSDFAVARALADEAMVFRDGKVVERGAVSELLANPRNPYTRSLVSASHLRDRADASASADGEVPLTTPERLDP